MSLRIRRGTNAQRTGGILDQGELGYTTDTKKLYIGDGVSYGGKNVVSECAGTGLSWNDTTQLLEVGTLTTTNVTEGTNKYFSDERAQDAVSTLFVHNNHVNISFTYDDMNNKIIATATGGGGASLPTNASGYLRNNGSGTLVWTSILPTDASGFLKNNGGGALTWASIFPANAAGFLGNNGSGALSWYPALTSVFSDTAPTLGGDLDINSFTINGTGNIDITGNITHDGIFNNGSISLSSNEISCSSSSIRVTSAESKVMKLIGTTSGSTLAGIPNLSFESHNGTNLLPTDILPGDYLSALLFRGFTVSSGLTIGSGIVTQLENTADTSAVWADSTLTIFTGKNTNTPNTFTFNSKGVFNAPILQASSYITSELPTSPEAGWIVFDSTSEQFKGWNGNAWIILG